MVDEMIDVYDDVMRKIGTMTKKGAHLTGAWHKAFHCWIVYKATGGEPRIVVQRRGPDKAQFPNALDITAAGHYKSGETVADGMRELQEELGISVSFDALIPLGIKHDVTLSPGTINREFDEVFLLEHDQDILTYNLQVDEVAGVAEFSAREAVEMFAGKREFVKARAAMMQTELTGRPHLVSSEIQVRSSDFIPRVDAYYFKIAILAIRYLNGEKYLAI
jgi:isopentenyldiphosphate isomerase